MSGDTVGVLQLRIAGNLVMARGTRICFGGFDERSPDALPLEVMFDVPALDEWHWRRTAPRCVLSIVQFQESDESPVNLCNKDDRGLGSRLEEPARLIVVI